LRTVVKNAGNTENTISEEKSLKRLVRPRKKMFFGSPQIRGRGLCAISDWWRGMSGVALSPIREHPNMLVLPQPPRPTTGYGEVV
jgi:hypothetical protein